MGDRWDPSRLLFGPNRAGEPPTPTEVFRFQELPQDFFDRYCRAGLDVQWVGTREGFEVRRAPWLRIVGPIAEYSGDPESTGGR